MDIILHERKIWLFLLDFLRTAYTTTLPATYFFYFISKIGAQSGAPLVGWYHGPINEPDGNYRPAVNNL